MTITHSARSAHSVQASSVQAKKPNHFYHSIVSMESLRVRLDLFDFTSEEREKLMEVAERTLHHSILDLVLSELNEEDRKLFLAHHASENHDQIWKLLAGNVNNIEKKIKVTADSVARKLHNDLKKASRRKVGIPTLRSSEKKTAERP